MGLRSKIKGAVGKISGLSAIPFNMATTGLPSLGGSTPTAPTSDYVGAAQATAAGNLANTRATTAANRPNEYTPYGSRTWEQDPNNPDRWTSNVNLSPESQNLFDIGMQNKTGLAGLAGQSLGQTRDALSTPFSVGGEMPTYGDKRQSVMDAMLARVNTDVSRDRDRKHSELIAQGIPPGSEAYNRAMEQFDRQLTDARQQAEINATDLAGKEYQNALTGRRQGITESLLERQTPLNEYSALTQGSQVQTPQFQPYGQQSNVAGPDYLGAAQAQSAEAIAAANAKQAEKNAWMQGLFGLGAGALSGGLF